VPPGAQEVALVEKDAELPVFPLTAKVEIFLWIFSLSHSGQVTPSILVKLITSDSKLSPQS